MKRRPKFWIWPYNGQSHAAFSLAEALGGKIIKRRNSLYRNQVRDFVINWGSTTPVKCERILNSFAAVRKATSKMETFRACADAGLRTPPFTQDPAVAREWLARGRVLGRDLDRGSQGRGVTIYNRGDELGKHLFYVRYMRKEREFRVHVVNGSVIFVQEKLRKNGAENANAYIRSHGNGWCFAFHHLEQNPAPQAVLDLGVAAVRCLGLDFGACDIAWSERSGATILEVNTAPGIEESSLAAYADAFHKFF